ncbi:MAG TPA: hypothetical protein VGH28_31690 [Polyangiaceae bacterium]|jgi:hypothetical protein
MNRFFWLALAGAVCAACSGVSSDLLGDSGAPEQDSAAPQLDASHEEHDAASTEDASVPKEASVIDVGQPDVWTGPPDSKIQCGPQLGCSAQNEMCCWHMASSSKPYECVSNANDCAGTYDVPMTCSSTDNCASQGNAGYQCCATGGQFGFGQCSGYDVATVVACKASCEVTDYEIGCSVQQQNCSDSLSTCVVSKCTAPGDTMCY